MAEETEKKDTKMSRAKALMTRDEKSAKKSVKKKLHEIRIRRAKGGFIATHRFHNKSDKDYDAGNKEQMPEAVDESLNEEHVIPDDIEALKDHIGQHFAADAGNQGDSDEDAAPVAQQPPAQQPVGQ